MNSFQYYIVDVFANNKYEGNQLAVFLDFENKVDDQQMQAIAKEINFAEITFIKKDKGNRRFVVRIFTPEHELPFAGHPSIGTSFIIARFLLPEVKPTLTLELKHGDIEISIAHPHNIDDSIFYMRQTQPEFRETFTHEEVATELGIAINDVEKSLPIQEISTGVPYILIPIKNLQAMENMKLEYSPFQNFLEKRRKYKTNSVTGHSTSLFFFTKETYEKDNSYNTRMRLLENDQLSEDAATGSANGCFLAYLLKYENPKISAVVEQGFQVNRKSYIYLEGEFSNEKYAIHVGGRTKLISEGAWFI